MNLNDLQFRLGALRSTLVAEQGQRPLIAIDALIREVELAQGGASVPLELRETLADLRHQSWAGWMVWLFSQCKYPPELPRTGVPDGARIIPPEWVERWERQMNTPYADLTEEEKASDRREVAVDWPFIVEFVAQWMERNSLAPAAEAFREDMTRGA